MKISFAAWACILFSACTGDPRREAEFKLGAIPPTPKEVIAAVIAHSHLPLSDASCRSAGTQLTDKTMARYLAGFLAELSSQEARNAITTSVEERVENGTPVYVCRMMIRHAQGEDIWSWGVEFSARRNDGVVLPDSIKCVGAG